MNELTGETAGVSVLEDGELLYLDHVESTEQVQVRSWTGERVKPHLVPSGLMLLAHLPEGRLKSYLSRPLEAPTLKSVVDPELVRQRLDLVRQARTIWIYGEFDEGINSIAALVRDQTGHPIGSLHIHGPAYRFPGPGESDKISAALADAADRMSQQLA